MGKLSYSFNAKPKSTIPLQFWNDISMAAAKDKPSIVRKYNLTPSQIEEAAARIKKENESKNSWAVSACKQYARCK
jgi:hypothetical protein